MTDALPPLLEDFTNAQVNIDFYTAPATAPPSINDEETTRLSTEKTLPGVMQYIARRGQEPQHPPYSAYLVACYSAHPITPILRTSLASPVINIFEASVIKARSLGRPFGIVTTGQYWESALGDAVPSIAIGAEGQSDPKLGSQDNFVGVRSTGLTASELHSTPRDEVHRRIVQASASLVKEGAELILLGCCAMSGMDEAVVAGGRAEGKDVEIIDGVRVGVELLVAWSQAKAE
jgi:Asp/Glu/hydantoin racemase